MGLNLNRIQSGVREEYRLSYRKYSAHSGYMDRRTEEGCKGKGHSGEYTYLIQRSKQYPDSITLLCKKSPFLCVLLRFQGYGTDSQPGGFSSSPSLYLVPVFVKSLKLFLPSAGRF